MKRFLLVAALAAVLSSTAWAENMPTPAKLPLPPVPRAAEMSDSQPVPTVDASEEVTPVERSRLRPQMFSNRRTQQAPSCAAAAPTCTTAVGPAQAPSCSTALRPGPVRDPSCAASLPGPAQDPTCEALAPTCEAHAFTHCRLHVRACDPGCESCHCRPQFQPVKALVNEFVRKPIYGIQHLVNESEASRLDRQERRLACEAERLACQANELAHRAANTCHCDSCAKARLVRSEVNFANKANRLTLQQAELEAKREANDLQSQRLRAKHYELFPMRN